MFDPFFGSFFLAGVLSLTMAALAVHLKDMSFCSLFGLGSTNAPPASNKGDKLGGKMAWDVESSTFPVQPLKPLGTKGPLAPPELACEGAC